jgi:hypothetical protein
MQWRNGGGVAVVVLTVVSLLVGVVCGKDVVVGAGAYPRFVRVNGTVLCAVDGVVGSGSHRAITVYATSEASLANWAVVGEVTRMPAAEYDVANPHMAVLPSGSSFVVLVAFRVRNLKTGESWLDLCASQDAGRTWQWRSQIVHTTNADAHQYEPFVQVLGARELLVVFASEVSPAGVSVMPDQMILARRSQDAGATWGALTVVAPHEVGCRPGMPSLVELGAGQLLVFYEMMSNGGKWGIFMARSPDAGKTWTALHTAVWTDSPYSGAPWATLVCPLKGTCSEIRVVWMADSAPPAAKVNGRPEIFAATLAAQWEKEAVIVPGHMTALYGYWPSVFQSSPGFPIVTARSEDKVLAFIEELQ